MPDTNEFLQTPLPIRPHETPWQRPSVPRVRGARPKPSTRFAALIICASGLLAIGLLHLKDQRDTNIASFRATAQARAATLTWIRQATPIVTLRLPSGKDIQFSGQDLQPINSWYEPHPTQWYQGKAVVHARVAEGVHAELRYAIAVGQLVPVYSESSYIAAADVAQRLARSALRANADRKPSAVQAAKNAMRSLFRRAPHPAPETAGPVTPAAPSAETAPAATSQAAPAPLPAEDDPIAAFASKPASAASAPGAESSARTTPPAP